MFLNITNVLTAQGRARRWLKGREPPNTTTNETKYFSAREIFVRDG